MAVTGLPFESEALGDAVEGALATLDGSGVRPTIAFEFDGELEAESLPTSAAASLAPEASVFLIDVDASSPDAFDRVPIELELARNRRSIRARVAFDRALTPGRRYAAVVTDSLRERSSNRRVAPSLRLERILDATTPLADASEKQARAQYLPILPALEADGIVREHVVALTSFRVQSAERDLDEVRATLSERDRKREPVIDQVIAGEALDEALGSTPLNASGAILGKGVDHQHVAQLVHVSIETPMFANVAQGLRAAFERDAQGALVRRGEHDVPCSLLVPRSVDSRPLPVVLFQHGLFGERSDALPVANELAATGYAVLTCDAPLHGSRLRDSDEGNRFTGASEPDGFGDIRGDVLGQEPGAGELSAGHPFYYRDAIQQAVADWIAIVATVRAGSWDAALQEALDSDQTSLARDNIGFIGVDVGAEIGVALSAREPEIRAAVLAFTGGRGLDDWNAGPDYGALREPFADSLAGDDEGGFSSAFRVDASVLRALLDPATALGHAAALRRTSTNLLLYIAEQDELVPRKSSEAVAYGVGADLVDGEPRYELDLHKTLALPGTGNSGNFMLSRGAVTRVAQTLSPATRASLFTSAGVVRFEHPLDAEPTALSMPRNVTNPTAAVLRQIAFYFVSHRRCREAESDPTVPCEASVSPLANDR